MIKANSTKVVSFQEKYKDSNGLHAALILLTKKSDDNEKLKVVFKLKDDELSQLKTILSNIKNFEIITRTMNLKEFELYLQFIKNLGTKRENIIPQFLNEEKFKELVTGSKLKSFNNIFPNSKSTKKSTSPGPIPTGPFPSGPIPQPGQFQLGSFPQPGPIPQPGQFQLGSFPSGPIPQPGQFQLGPIPQPGLFQQHNNAEPDNGLPKESDDPTPIPGVTPPKRDTPNNNTHTQIPFGQSFSAQTFSGQQPFGQQL